MNLGIFSEFVAMRVIFVMEFFAVLIDIITHLVFIIVIQRPKIIESLIVENKSQNIYYFNKALNSILKI